VEAVLERSFHDRGVPAIGLWVQVPHYIAAMAYPGASTALVDAVADTAGLSIPADELRDEAARLRVRLDELVAANPEHVAMVAQLEEAYDSVDPIVAGAVVDGLDATNLPTGDELAAELERFLREQGG
jgi:predicted ATP-grasp superfamily ATP-dependent carboligase